MTYPGQSAWPAQAQPGPLRAYDAGAVLNCVWLDVARLKLVVTPARVLLEGRRGRVTVMGDHPGGCTCGN